MSIKPNAAADSFTGTAGNDNIVGTTGADTMTGLAGNDTYTVNNAGDVVVEALGEGTDLVNSTISYTLAPNVENLTLTSVVTTSTATTAVYPAINGTGNGLDNTIRGSAGNNILSGLAGNDTFIAGAGNDLVFGGTGDDVLNESADTSGINDLNGGAGNDRIYGGALADTISGGTGDDLLLGNSGNDTITGGAGIDAIWGGAGDDSIRLNGSGADTVYLNLNAEFADGTDTAYQFSQGTDKISLVSLDASFNRGGGFTLPSLDGAALTGTDLQDAINNAVASQQASEDGHDRILSFDNGTTLILKDVDADVTGNDFVGYVPPTPPVPDADLTLNGDANANVLVGGSGNDTINGLDGNDTLIGNAGNDVLNGGNGADTITTGTGYDLIVAASGDSALLTPDRVTDFVVGQDRIDVSGYAGLLGLASGLGAGAANKAVAQQVGNNTYIAIDSNGALTTLNQAETLIRLEGISASQINTTSFYGIDRFSDGDTSGNPDGFVGSNLGDLFIATNGNQVETYDVVDAGAGTDIIRLQGTAGALTLGQFLKGIDKVEVNTAWTTTANTITFTNAFVAASDNGASVELANGSNQVSVNTDGLLSGYTVYVGGTGTVSLDNTVDNGHINAKDAVNTDIVGSSKIDVIVGGTGNDKLSGGLGNDTLQGGSGTDILIGGIGADALTGGAGNDRYTYNNAGESSSTSTDSVTDFAKNEDVVDLTSLASSNPFTGGFNGTTAKANSVWAEQSGSDVLIKADITGDTTADLVVRLLAPGFTAADVTSFDIEGLLRFTSSLTDNLVGNGNANTFTLALSTDLNPTDVVNGGAGEDTILISAGAGGVTYTFTGNLKGVDVIDVRAVGATLVFQDAFVANSDAQTVTLSSSSVATTINTSALTAAQEVLVGTTNAVTLANGVSNGNITVKDDTAGNIILGTGSDSVNGGAKSDTFTVDAANLASTDFLDGKGQASTGNGDTLVLTGTSAVTKTAADLTGISNIEYWSLNSSQNYNLTLNQNNVASGALLTIANTSGSSGTMTVDASAETDGRVALTQVGTGKLTATLNGSNFEGFSGTGATAITGAGASDDTITLKSTSTVDLNAGELQGVTGVEVLNIGSNVNYTLALNDANINANNLQIVGNSTTGLTTGSVTIDASAETYAAAGRLSVDFSGATTPTGKISVITSVADIVGAGGTDLKAGGATNDELKLTASAAATLSATDLQDVENFETLTLGSDQRWTVTTHDHNVASGKSLTIDGQAILTATNKLTVDIQAETNGNISVIGGAGDDTLTADGDVWEAGTTVHSFNGGSSSDTLILAMSAATDLNSTELAGVSNVETIKTTGAQNITLQLNANNASSGQTVTVDVTSANADANNVVITAGALTTGNVTLRVSGNQFGSIAGDSLTGGQGTLDTLEFVGAGVNVDATEGLSITNFETINFDGDYAHVFTASNNTVAPGKVLAIGQVANTGTTGQGSLNFQGGSELDGSFNVVGTAGFDTIAGGAVADTLAGGAGNDNILGNDGIDTIDGGAGADILDGGNGNDTTTGGSGNDRLFMREGGDQLDGGDDSDTLVMVNPLAGNTIVDLSVASGVDQVLSLAGTANSALQINFENVDASGITGGSVQITGSTADNALVGGSFGDVLSGGNGNDVLEGGDSADNLTGGAGTDYFAFDNRAVNDSPNSAEDSIVDFQTAADYVIARGVVTDTFVASPAHVQVSGNELQIDMGINGVFTDTNDFNVNGFLSVSSATAYSRVLWDLIGDDDASVITGSAGNDILTGGSLSDNAADTLNGVGGNDTFLILSAAQHATGEIINGGAGNDTLRFTSTIANDNLVLLFGVTNVEQFEIANAIGDTSGRTSLSLNASAVAGSIKLVGNDGNNILTGNAAGDYFVANAGTDRLIGGAGNDTFNLGSNLTSADTVEGAGNTDVLLYTDATTAANDLDLATDIEQVVLGDAATTLTLVNTTFTSNGVINASALTGTHALTLDASLETSNSLTIIGGAAADTIKSTTGASGDDTIVARGGDDIISGDATDVDENDTIVGGGGNDTITLAATTADFNDDTVVLATGDGIDTINNFDIGLTSDVLNFSGFNFATGLSAGISTFTNLATANDPTTNAVIALDDDTIQIANASALNGTDFTTGTVTSVGKYIVFYAASAGGDTRVAVADVSDTGVISNAQDLAVLSGVQPDGGAGAWVGTNVTLMPTAGGTIWTGSGDDSITGTANPDTFQSSTGNDTLNGGVGADVLNIWVASDLTSSDLIDLGTSNTDNDTLALLQAGTYDFTGYSATALKGVDTINFTSAAPGYSLTLVDNVVSSADGNFNGVADGTVNITSTVTGNVNGVTINASALTALTGPNLISVTGTNLGGSDTITGGAGADIIGSGAGDDIITGGAGKDSVTVGAGNDTIKFAAGVADTVATATSIAGVDLYSDLLLHGALADQIDLTVTVANANTSVTGTLTQATFITDINNLLNVGGGAGFNTAVNGDISAAVVVANAGDLNTREFLAVDLDGSNTFTATDFVIEITASTVTSLTTGTFI
jgi:Ca2+-binding RTX toxin-like protein